MQQLDASNLVNGFTVTSTFPTTVDIRNSGPSGGKILIQTSSPSSDEPVEPMTMFGEIDVFMVQGKFQVQSRIHTVNMESIPGTLLEEFNSMSTYFTELVVDVSRALESAFVPDNGGPSLKAFVDAIFYYYPTRRPEIPPIVLGMIPNLGLKPFLFLLKKYRLGDFMRTMLRQCNAGDPVDLVASRLLREYKLIGPNQTAKDEIDTVLLGIRL